MRRLPNQGWTPRDKDPGVALSTPSPLASTSFCADIVLADHDRVFETPAQRPIAFVIYPRPSTALGGHRAT